MLGVYLPGQRRVVLADVEDPKPGHGQVVVKMRASSICGSDLRAIYREHLGRGPEAYQGVIGGHEPCGDIVDVGPGCRRFRVGDRVVLYHISGCGLCADCRDGYMISCTSPLRAAYGWQRDGGHADYLLAEESTCVPLPDSLSYVDGSSVACSFGTAYQALCRADLSGRDAALITGMGPVGLAVGLLAGKMGAPLRIGVDISAERLDLALRIGAIDHAVPAGPDADAQIADLTSGLGCEVSVDASGSAQGRLTAVTGTRHWGRCVLVGEGGRLEVDASPALIHPQLTLLGSWVTSIGRMEELVHRLDRWGLHPEVAVTHRFGLRDAEQAYRTADEASAGKVAIVM
ncbi:MAG TPA: zinc-binding dehydrogenase [Micromonosporaceae bacterium]|nr:zinc-binding dehydrogenase [Micromonosporaceae bacterium]